MTRLRRHACPLLFAVIFAIGWVVLQAGASAPAQITPPSADGRQLFVTGCSSCHGIDGGGTEQGPPLQDAGAASAYYYLSTGRMPLADDQAQPRRKRPVYSPAEIDLLVGYIASLGHGPAIPEVHPAKGDLAEGGELYRSHCGPCHTAAGIGGALSYGRAAPSIHSSTPLQVAAAIRTGPGQMPVFGPETMDQHELDSVVKYVQFLRAPATPGGAALGSAGPIPEGFVAWLFGVGTLILAVFWIGRRQEQRGQE